MRSRIVKLTGHQIICGYGRTGQEVAKAFVRDNVNFVVIEQEESRVLKAESQGMLVLKGDASDDDTLAQAQIEKAAGIVCALPDDMQNTFIALTARGMNENIDVVSRAANPGSENKLRRAGVRMIISPYVICGQRLAAAVTQPLVTEFLDVVMRSSGIDLRMEQITLVEGSKLIGLSLKDANIKQTSGAMIVAVKQNGKLITNPSPDLKFSVGDDLIALGAEQQLSKVSELAGN
jgi:voltage-gated potassium channel